MSVKVYKDGAWKDIVPYIYKDGAWKEASSLKVYENGVWVEKIANYKNATITVSEAGFAENASNYIKGSANKVAAQIGRSKSNGISLTITLIPPSNTNHFGKYPMIRFDAYIKNSNTINSNGSYGIVSIEGGGTGYQSVWSTGGYILMPTDTEVISRSLAKSPSVSNSYNEDLDMGSLYITVYIRAEPTMTIPATTYIEISNITVDGVPYGVNTTITP